MNTTDPKELYVSFDVGCYSHYVAVGLANGDYLGNLEISHDKQGFAKIFA